jgi:hypothetical protein
MITCASIGVILILITPTESYSVQTDRIQTITPSANGVSTVFNYYGFNNVIIRNVSYTETMHAIQNCQNIGS